MGRKKGGHNTPKPDSSKILASETIAESKPEKIQGASPGGSAPAGTPTPGEQTSAAPLKTLADQYREDQAAKELKRKNRTAKVIQAEKVEAFMAGLPMFTRLGMSIVGRWLPDKTPFTPDEISYMEQGVTAVARKYFETVASYDAELTLALAIGMVIVPRMFVQQEPKPNERPKGDIDTGKNGNGEINPGQENPGSVSPHVDS